MPRSCLETTRKISASNHSKKGVIIAQSMYISIKLVTRRIKCCRNVYSYPIAAWSNPPHAFGGSTLERSFEWQTFRQWPLPSYCMMLRGRSVPVLVDTYRIGTRLKKKGGPFKAARQKLLYFCRLYFRSACLATELSVRQKSRIQLSRETAICRTVSQFSHCYPRCFLQPAWYGRFVPRPPRCLLLSVCCDIRLYRPDS